MLAGATDLNASYKDLGAVCDSIRYKPVESALSFLESAAAEETPVLFRRHNKGMGSRHELGGKKGRYPKKCAAMVRKVLLNAVANARSRGFDESTLFVVHAAANKTQVMRRGPSKGMLYHSDSYGFATIRHSDLVLSKVEIGVAEPDEAKLGPRARLTMKREQRAAEKIQPKKASAKPSQKPAPKKKAEPPKPQAKPAAEAKAAPSPMPAQPQKGEQPKTEAV